MVLAEKVKKMFHEEGIHSTTIQPEFVELEVESVNSDENCILDCPSTDKDDCAANTCCGPTAKQVKDVTAARHRGAYGGGIDGELGFGGGVGSGMQSLSYNDLYGDAPHEAVFHSPTTNM